MGSPGAIAVVVRHYPGRGRLSGLVGFSRQLTAALARRRNVIVFSADQKADDGGLASTTLRWVRVPRPFWLQVWHTVRRSRAERMVVLSGIHQPRWLRLMAILMRFAGLPAARCLFVQGVSLSGNLRRGALASLAQSGGVAVMNPAEAARLRQLDCSVQTITPGLDVEAITRGPRLTSTSAFRIGFFGHCNAVKGADRIPAILGRLAGQQGWDCIVCGTGELSVELRDWATTQPSVQFFGYLDDPFPALRSCDVLLAPFRQSATVLGISQVVIEALALGIPVVGTPIEAIAQAVDHGVQGLLGETDDELGAYLLVLKQDAALRHRMSNSARAKAPAYGIDNVVDALLAAFPDQRSRI